jgi:hypothetical protein
MGFDAITAWSIPLESSHRAGSNGIEHVAIGPKLKNLSSNCSYPACQDLLISSNKHRTKISNPLKMYPTSTNLSRTRL